MIKLNYKSINKIQLPVYIGINKIRNLWSLVIVMCWGPMNLDIIIY